MREVYEELKAKVMRGDQNGARELVRKLLDAGEAAKKIIDMALIPAMNTIGDKFQDQEIFIPELLVAARAMEGCMAILQPLLAQSDVNPEGMVVIGTCKGDLHDIGKNIVAAMLKGSGFEIIDLGIDCAPAKFADAVRDKKPDLVAMSALLTTTMRSMKETIEALKAAGLRDSVKIMVGGAPLTQEYADEIGADGFAPDASQAVKLAKKLLAH